MGAQPACSCSSVQTQGGKKTSWLRAPAPSPQSSGPVPSSVPLPDLSRPQACLQLPKLKAQAGVWVAVGGPQWEDGFPVLGTRWVL